jgi:type 1 glutamine amidotransferase
MNRGCGLVCLHYAVAAPPGAEAEFLEWLGGYWEKDYSKNPISTARASPGMPQHPVCRGWDAFTARDEFYYQIRFKEGDRRLVPVATAMLPTDAPKEETIAWALERADGGRSFGFTGGHFHETWRIEPVRTMVLNAILWTAKMDVPARAAPTRSDDG